MKGGAAYLVANRRYGAVYAGSTSNLVQRTYQHRNLLIDGHTKENGCTRLVWFEMHSDLQQARLRERQIKKWKRAWKIRLIEEANPDWRDLWFDIRQAV